MEDSSQWKQGFLRVFTSERPTTLIDETKSSFWPFLAALIDQWGKQMQMLKQKWNKKYLKLLQDLADPACGLLLKKQAVFPNHNSIVAYVS